MIKKNFELGKLNIKNFNLFLMYGKNEGLKKEIIDKHFTENFLGQINKYDEHEFINNAETITSEILNKSLFDSEKLIIISRVTEKILSFIKDLNQKEIADVKIILNSNQLDKKSKLRNYFEKDKKLIVIPFYEDDFKNLFIFANKFLIENKIKLSKESLNLIISRANGDRANLRNELDKILMYSYTNNRVEIETVKKLTNISENYDVNILADNFLSKNKTIVTKILNENNYSNEDCILILRTILSKSKRLMGILERYKDNKNVEEIISSTRPPIFWKDKENVKKQIASWNLDDLKNKIYKINEIELFVKNNSTNSVNIISDFILNY